MKQADWSARAPGEDADIARENSPPQARPPCHNASPHDDAPPVFMLVAAFAAVYIIWGSTYLAIRYMVETLPPFGTAGVRFLIAGGILLAIAGRRVVAGLRWPMLRDAGIVGTLLLLGGNGLVCWAEQWVASGLTALLISTVPLWLVLLDWLFFRGPRPTKSIVAGLIIGLVGVWVLIGPEQILQLGPGASAHQTAVQARQYLAGCLALLIACAAWALGSLYSRRANLPKPSWLAAGWEMVLGGAVLVVVGLLRGEFGRFDPHNVAFHSVAAFAYLVVFGSLLGLTAYLWLLQVTTPARVGTYAYVNPVIAVLLGAALAGEPLNWRIGTGAAIVLAAVVMITRQVSRPAHPKTR